RNHGKIVFSFRFSNQTRCLLLKTENCLCPPNACHPSRLLHIIKPTMPSTQGSTPQPTERVFLIDSFSHIFRAFFAPMGGRMEPLRNSSGQVTQAVFVFTNMLRKLLADEQPHYIAAVFESGVPTFRHEMAAHYKAHRAEMPDELASQIPY